LYVPGAEVQDTALKIDVGTGCRQQDLPKQKPSWFSGHKTVNITIPSKKPRPRIPKLQLY